MICVDPVGALPRPARLRPIFYPWANANGPERTLCVTGLRRPAGDTLSFEEDTLDPCNQMSTHFGVVFLECFIFGFVLRQE
jgi:hypothetical protein